MNRKKAVVKHIQNKIRKKNGEAYEMEDIILKHMDQGVSVTTIQTTAVGRLKSYKDGWITIDYKGKETDINCEYIVSIHPAKLPKEKSK